MGKASTRAQNKYIAKAYDRVNLTLPKGQKDVVQAHAAAHDESVNGFIGRAISETMERDTTQNPAEATQTKFREGVVSLPSGTLEHAGEAADAAGEGVSVRQAAEVVRAAGMVCLPSKMMETVRAAADAAGETDAAFLWRAIAALDAEAVQAAGVVALPVETVEKAQAAADRTGEIVPEFVSRAVETQATRDNASLRMGINPAAPKEDSTETPAEGK